MYPKAEIKDFTLKKTYGQKTEGARDSRWRALPLIHAACSRLLDESSRQLEEVTLSHAPPQESPRARRSALTKWQLRGTHARTHRSSSGRGWPARTTPPACFLVTCGLVLHFHSANCLFIGSPRQPRSFHGVKPPPPFLPTVRRVASRRWSRRQRASNRARPMGNTSRVSRFNANWKLPFWAPLGAQKRALFAATATVSFISGGKTLSSFSFDCISGFLDRSSQVDSLRREMIVDT